MSACVLRNIRPEIFQFGLTDFSETSSGDRVNIRETVMKEVDAG